MYVIFLQIAFYLQILLQIIFNLRMGNICPCPWFRKQKETTYSYDVHQQTFQMDDNIQNIGQNSPKTNENNVLTDDLRSSQENMQMSQNSHSKKQSQSQPIAQYSQKHIQMESKQLQTQNNQSFIEAIHTQNQPNPPSLAEKQPEKIAEPEKPLSANILRGKKPVIRKYNPDDYRFKDQSGSFKVKKIGSLKQQQFNIQNCKNSFFFIFDVTGNVYIDDTSDCFIFIAPCQSTVFVRSCRNLTVVAATKQFRTFECHDSAFILYCKSQPVIESSSNLNFSSFTCPNYAQLSEQFSTIKLEPFNNHWSQIHNFTKQAGVNHYTLHKNIDVSYIQWSKAFSEAEIEMNEQSDPVPFINGDIDYLPTKQIIIIIKDEIDQQSIAKALSYCVILRAFEGVIKEEGKKSKKAVLIDPLQESIQKLEELGTITSSQAEVQNLKSKLFIKFSDERQK